MAVQAGGAGALGGAAARKFPVQGKLAQRAQAGTALRHFPRLGELAAVAAFVVSDRTGAVRAAILNMALGSLID
jgi:hypothetical protein